MTAVKDPGVFLVESILKRRKGKVLIKWLGYPLSEATWEDEAAFLHDDDNNEKK